MMRADTMRFGLVTWLIRRFVPAFGSGHRTIPEVLPPEPAPEPAPERIKLTAVELLQNEPNLTAAVLAERAGVTLSYARTLVRKRRPRSVAAPAAPRVSLATTESAEASCRTRILEQIEGGVAPDSISDELGVTPGEIEFLLKITRLQKKLKV